MPKNNTPAGKRPAKNFDPKSKYGENKRPFGSRPGAKSGSKSEGHRGYRPDAGGAPQKSRWNADERAERAARFESEERGDRAPRGDRNDRPAYNRGGDRNERPAYNRGGDRNERPAYNRGERTERPSHGDRNERPAYNRGGDRNERPAYNRGERTERPSYGDRNERPAYNRGGDRNERPAYNRGERSERPSYGDRNERPSYNRGERTERPSYGDRNERPAYNRGERSERPSYGDRNDRPASNRGGDRTERPAYNRGERSERPSYGDRNDRPAYNRGGDRNERPAYNRGERTERPSYGDRTERPAYNRGERTERPSYGDRPARQGDPRQANRTDRPARSYDDRPKRSFEDRPARSYDDRPKRSFDDRPKRSFDDRGASDAGRGSDYYPKRDAGSYTPQDDVVLERLEADAIQAGDVEGVTFESLGLGGNIVRALAELGADSPFPIQAATIPDVIAGRDVLGRGRTGSGKTIAFGAPLVEKLMENGGGKNRKPGRKPRALILAPTRELALQIDRTVQPIARAVGLFTTQIYGGVPQGRQVGALQRGVDIIVGTPGRIEDLIEQGRLDLSQVTVTVLDEADHMCDLGFLEPVQRILRRTAPDGQKLLFSATLDKGVAALVNEFLPNPSVHEVAGEDQASSTIDHRVLVVEHKGKDRLIEELVNRTEKTLVFARTRAYAERLAEQLGMAGIPAVSLHGDLNQARRTRNLEKLTSGRVNVLVATDVAARGIHVDDITLVVQADAPDEYKTYLHRAGRTGRAGKIGRVVTIIPKARRRRMTELLDRAEIEAAFDDAAPGDQLVEDIATA
ncbi:DEAD/DEAH box helicase [Plantibacter cousiniae (nom. nud.)]|uniref:Superfamily II DNA and RNA helicase n=1 Tax=Plantibacter cousiniae (nom. nud.) TaxID=199709 RepID=A0ABY1LM98_9MICO|nr:DEAD/DEAH box helicase [Plantibacter cousiniae]SKC46149.1 Superfamily II DNA and RNA helicase [Plantibacter cousiniae]